MIISYKKFFGKIISQRKLEFIKQVIVSFIKTLITVIIYLSVAVIFYYFYLRLTGDIVLWS